MICGILQINLIRSEVVFWLSRALNIVPADALAMSVARASTGTILTKFQSQPTAWEGLTVFMACLLCIIFQTNVLLLFSATPSLSPFMAGVNFCIYNKIANKNFVLFSVNGQFAKVHAGHFHIAGLKKHHSLIPWYLKCVLNPGLHIYQLPNSLRLVKLPFVQIDLGSFHLNRTHAPY